MLLDGAKIRIEDQGDQIWNLVFNASSGSVNKMDQDTFIELIRALRFIQEHASKSLPIKGLLISSAKDQFIVGADVTEFSEGFLRPAAELEKWLLDCHALFNQIEDFSFPVVCLIDGNALGGGCELALSAHFRIATPTAFIGLPEIKLGIFPGWGGTIRLSRLIGLDHALEWILTGKSVSGQEALLIGAVDAMVEKPDLITAGINLIQTLHKTKTDFKKRSEEKKGALLLNSVEQKMVFTTARAMAFQAGAKQMPHLLTAIDVMEKGAGMLRADAQKEEAKGFVEVAQKDAAKALVGIFLGGQLLKKQVKKLSVSPVKKAAVLGAGIMGGGIAFQSASAQIPILMKDLQNSALEKGIKESVSLMEKQVQKKKMTPKQFALSLSQILPTTDYHGFNDVDFVIEAVIENTEIKKKVLAEVEGHLSNHAILSSNTSSILISSLAEGLKRPEQFCGMHFFNPVHRMPLVEIIRGKKTSEETIQKALSYAVSMGKTPIVVNDCGGFLVNRVLFPYLIGFLKLIQEGQNFEHIDFVMEKFGWPMGPAFLLDVIGLDTAVHALSVMSKAYPDRMHYEVDGMIKSLFDKKCFGQKTAQGFYFHTLDKKGKPVKKADASLVSQLTATPLDEQQIVFRMMLPMIFESARCLEDKIVESPVHVDMGQILGLGFPAFRGGALRYADTLGSAKWQALAKQFEHLGPLYHLPESMRENPSFYRRSL